MRVMDLVFLPPGTVIANFVYRPGFLRRFPNQHGYHASLFVGYSPYRQTTGEPVGLIVVDQWVGRKVSARTIIAYNEEEAKRKRVKPCDNANEFYVVMT